MDQVASMPQPPGPEIMVAAVFKKREWMELQEFTDRLLIRKEVEQFFCQNYRIALTIVLGLQWKFWDHFFWVKINCTWNNFSGCRMSHCPCLLEIWKQTHSVMKWILLRLQVNFAIMFFHWIKMIISSSHTRDIKEPRTDCLFVITLYGNLVRNTYCLQLVVERPKKDSRQSLPMLILQ